MCATCYRYLLYYKIEFSKCSVRSAYSSRTPSTDNRRQLTSSDAPSCNNRACSFLAVALYLAYPLSPRPKTAKRISHKQSLGKLLFAEHSRKDARKVPIVSDDIV